MVLQNVVSIKLTSYICCKYLLFNHKFMPTFHFPFNPAAIFVYVCPVYFLEK